jgi:prevent-host-death family protein
VSRIVNLVLAADDKLPTSQVSRHRWIRVNHLLDRDEPPGLPPARAIRDRDLWLAATFMYMNTVGVAELRQNLSRYLRRVERGERLVVTDRNRPVAELGPPPTSGAALDRLLAEGRVSRPVRRVLPEPLELTGDAYALSRALDEVRGER